MKNIIIVVVVLAFLGGGIYLATQKTDLLQDVDDLALIESALLGSGSIVCNFVDPGYDYRDDEKVTVYIKNGMMRSFVEGQEIAFLVKGGYSYWWDEEGGMKVKITEGEMGTEVFVPFGVEDGEAYFFADEEFQLNCQRTSIDDSMFEIPEGIDIIDMDEMEMHMDWLRVEDEDGNWSDIDMEQFQWDPEMLEGVEGLEHFGL